MTYKRSHRIADLIRKEISNMLVMAEIKDPRIGFVTITKVILSEDLRHAKVFFSAIGAEEEKKTSLIGLEHSSGYIRRTLAKRLDLRHIPEIIFKYDDSIEYASHIDEVLKGLKSSESKQ